MSNSRKKIQRPNTQAVAPKVKELTLRDRLVFYFTASISGATVMMIELLGTRVIGPFYGVSLIVWTALLSVALLALSIGYLVGGRLADRASWLRLSHIILLAAIFIGIIPLISEPVQLAMNGLGMRAGALASAFVLFAPPLTLLGMVGPFVIKIATRRLDVIGSTAGNVYAVSTLGSVLGTLLLGFFLLPVAGTQMVILSLSLVLAALSFCLAIYEHKQLYLGKTPTPLAVSATTLAIVVMFNLGAVQGIQAYDDYNVIFEEETHYGWVRVVDQPDKNIRWLMSDSSTIGAEDLATGRSLLGYQEIVGLLPWFNQQGKDALLVGLGSGHLVNAFSSFGVTTDSIEIDPAVAKAANQYFSYQPSGDVIVGDARYQIKKLTKKYDFIVHDCFTGGSEPIHLLTREMIAELKALLKPGGILALNFVGFTVEEDNLPVASVAHTLDQEFPHRRTFISAPHAEFNDFIFLVSEQPLNIVKEPENADIVSYLKQHERTVSGNGGLIITDDFNPLESLQVAKAEYYRDLLIERVGADILFR